MDRKPRSAQQKDWVDKSALAAEQLKDTKVISRFTTSLLRIKPLFIGHSPSNSTGSTKFHWRREKRGALLLFLYSLWIVLVILSVMVDG